MPFSRTSKSLSSRIAPGVPVRRDALRRVRRFGGWAFAALAACWLLWNVGKGDDRIYHAGSISAAHQFIANDCARCHQSSWQPLVRLVTFDNASTTSTPDAACIACHQGSIHNEHPAAKMAHCAHCHREHHGQDALAAVDDRFCTDCHADLPKDSGEPFHFADHIGNFTEHPEFALFRPEASGDETATPRHGIYAVAKPNSDSQSAPWLDKTTLRFNHHKHLEPADPRGLPTPTLFENGVEIQPAGFERLDCQSCHEPDNAGRYFRPISFEQNCRRCHPLQYDATLQLGDPLPHRDVNLVRDVMRNRLAERFAAQTDVEKPDVAIDGAIPGLPRPLPLNEGELAWVNERLAIAEHVVFGKEAKGGCRFCHTIEETSSGFAVAPTAIPERWQTHARFNHERHRLLDCTACHDRTLASTSSAEILLPKLDSCRECHGADQPTVAKASDACVECHDFHDHRRDSLRGSLGLGLEMIAPRKAEGAP